VIRLNKQTPSSQKGGSGRSGWVVLFERGLILTSVVLVIYIGIRVFVIEEHPRGGGIIDTSGTTPRKIQVPQSPPFSEYAQVIGERELMGLPGRRSPLTSSGAQTNGDEPVVPFSNGDLSQNLKLVGIILDDNPVAVVEDRNKKETVFLSLGQRIGDAILQEIREGKAIFLYRGNNVELTP